MYGGSSSGSSWSNGSGAVAVAEVVAAMGVVVVAAEAVGEVVASLLYYV